MLSIPFLRQYLGGVDAGESLVIETLRDAVIADIEGMTGRIFQEPDDQVEYLSGSGGHTLELRAEVSSGAPTVSISYDNGVTWASIGASSVSVDRHPSLGINNLVTIAGYRWPTGIRNIKVEYAGGFEPDADSPAEIKALIGDWVALRYKERMGASNPEPKDAAGIPERFKPVLSRWKYPEYVEQTRLVRA